MKGLQWKLELSITSSIFIGEQFWGHIRVHRVETSRNKVWINNLDMKSTVLENVYNPKVLGVAFDEVLSWQK